MANKTARDVVKKALTRISLIASDEDPSDDDYQEALSEYKGFHAWLRSNLPRGVTWTYDSVPEDHFSHVAGWFSARLIGVFSIPESKIPTVQLNAQNSEKYLREIVTRKPRKTIKLPIV